MKITCTWYGTVALHLVVDGKLGIFLDPSIERPEGATPVVTADPETTDFSPVDLVFVSHSHFDHVFNLPNLLRRYPGAEAFAPPHTVENLRKFCSGKIFKDRKYPLDEDDWGRIQTIAPGDVVERGVAGGGGEAGGSCGSDGVRVVATAIKSAHVSFDQYAMDRALNSPEVKANFGYYSKFLMGFPEKDVVGWDLRIIAGGEEKRVVYFGSMCKRFRKVHARFAGCDYFFIPLAGRKDILPHGRSMVEVLRPKVVIPVHWDDFFPPVSFLVDTSNFEEWLAGEHPEVRLLRLTPEEPVEL
ncbi:MAG: MBL fold metallo-hydrolase [Promethearchaeota archaeon]